MTMERSAAALSVTQFPTVGLMLSRGTARANNTVFGQTSAGSAEPLTFSRVQKAWLDREIRCFAKTGPTQSFLRTRVNRKRIREAVEGKHVERNIR